MGGMLADLKPVATRKVSGSSPVATTNAYGISSASASRTRDSGSSGAASVSVYSTGICLSLPGRDLPALPVPYSLDC